MMNHLHVTATMNAEDDDLATTVVHRTVQEEERLDASGVRKALLADARASGNESAEAVYRSVVWLRDRLPPETQKQLAVCFEWAREGIAQQTLDEISADLKALHAAYAYARDVMLDAAKNNSKK